MREACVFPLDENVKSFKTMMNDKIRNYVLNSNVSIKGVVDDIQVQDIKILKDNIRIFVKSNGKLTLDVQGLDKF